MFTAVASTYDLINSVLTFGLDEVWRKVCAKECVHSNFIVDLCCGTGSLSRHLARLAPKAYVIGIDFSDTMLKRAKTKVNPHALHTSFILVDAAHLPFKDNCLERVCTSFSFRNLLYKNPKAMIYLREILRVLCAGGKFVCIETSQPKRRPLKMLYHLYLQKVVPLLGWLVSRQKGAYKYLGLSAANFPEAEKIRTVLLNVGFRIVLFKRLTFGIVALHIGLK